MPVKDTPFYSVIPGQPKRPYLRVEFINPHNGGVLKTYALIDTGADECVLPATFAQMLGHDLTKGTVYPISSANGQGVGYRHTTQITIPSFATQECMIGFLPGLTTPLLGVRSFLCNFTLTINYPGKTFSLRK